MRFMGLSFGGESGGGYNFTERVRRVLSLARDEAQRLHHEYVGTEHILLGLLREGDNIATLVLANLGVDPDQLRRRIEEIVKKGTSTQTIEPDLPYTSRAKRTLELAMSEAKHLDHAYVGTEHLLLGMLAEAKGIAAQVLTDAGCTLERVRAETLATLGVPEAERPIPPKRPPRTDGTDRLTGIVFDHLSSAPNHLSARAVAITSAANLHAVKRGSRAVRAEHLLHALLEHDEGSAAVVLERLGANRANLLADVDAHLGPAGTGGPETRLDSSELMNFLGLAEMEREQSDAPRVATHHLLLAVMAQSPIGNAVFSKTGITPERVRAEAARISG